MTTPNPTPNSMPGAQPSNPNPQMQNPVSTSTPPEPQQQAPVVPASTPAPTPPAQQPPAPPAKDDKKPEDDKTDWRAHARTWEQRARENEAAAKKWEEAEAARRTKEENQAIEIQKEREARLAAEANWRREKIARETGVLPMFLGDGTEDEMRSMAQQAIEWRGAAAQQAPPPPQTAAVSASSVSSADKMGAAPNGIQQLTKEQFIALPDAERMKAVDAGQCTNIGIGPRQHQRRMGNQLETGAYGGRQ